MRRRRSPIEPPVVTEARVERPADSNRDSIAALALPLVFLVLCLAFGVTQLTFDVLERSYLLEHPAECLMSRDGSPRSQFFFYAHMLELPLAYVFGLRWLGVSGHQALAIFESLCGAASLWFVYRLVRFWGGRRTAAWCAQLALAASMSFWRMSAGGEERISALASQLGFLWAFWSALSTGRGRWLVAATLALAILVHLTGLVLLPFAVAALFFGPREWRPHVRGVWRQVALGTLVAGTVFVAIAALTTGVRTPSDLVEYATFYHGSSGDDFFELAEDTPRGNRIQRIIFGMASFFAVVPWGRVALGELAALGALGGFIRWMGRAGFRGFAAAVRSASSGSSSLPAGRVRWLGIHGFILVALWTMHFSFYNPDSWESWFLPLALGIVITAVLWSTVFPWVLLVLPLTTLPGNWSYMVRLHREDNMHDLRRAIESVTAPGDIVLLPGGRVGGVLTEGSLVIRYALAMMPDRRVASLYDILQVGEGDYWRPPFRSAAELQSAIDAGAKVVTPSSLVPAYEKIAATGAIAIELARISPELAQVREFRPKHAFTFTPAHLSARSAPTP